VNTHAAAPDALTRRELQVMELLCTGISKAKIGQAIGISPGTVKFHLKHAYQKLGAKGAIQAALAFDRARRPAAV